MTELVIAHCPACKAPMYAREHVRGILDVCPKCGGQWFDHAEMPELPALRTVRSGPVVRRCPRCGARLETLQAPRDSALRVDICQEHGLFLDRDELAHVHALTAAGDRAPPSEAAPAGAEWNALGALAQSPRDNVTPAAVRDMGHVEPVSDHQHMMSGYDMSRDDLDFVKLLFRMLL